MTGTIAEGQAHLDRALSLYDPLKHRQLATRFGHDIRSAAWCFRSWATWLLGYPEAALADADHALAEARETGHVASLMHTLGHVPFTFCECGSYAKAKLVVDELARFAEDKGTLLWKALVMMNQGWLLR